LDIDDLDQARWILATLENMHAPTVATTRGRHLYFQGLGQSTIALGYGELRGLGSYVIAPPSIHPSGKLYAWLEPPNGPLPPVPGNIAADRKSAGAGVREPRERVPHGERHSHLKDLAVRVVRSGVTEANAIERILVAEYEAVCDKQPAAKTGYFAEIAKWAAGSKIAERERERKTSTAAVSTSDSEELGSAPGHDATLAEHRQFVGAAGGWQPHNDIADIQRYGNNPVDAMTIQLTNGLTIDFRHQGDITNRGMWTKTVIAGTNGIAMPRQLKTAQLDLVYRSLCILAGVPERQAEADTYADILADLLTLMEPVTAHHVQDSTAIFALIEMLKMRAKWDPRDRNTTAQPALIVDSVDHAQYLRAGELRDYFMFRNAGVATTEFPGRMNMIGLRQTRLNGREAARIDAGIRRTNRVVLYRLPDPETGAL
jgi:hypothetical protein